MATPTKQRMFITGGSGYIGSVVTEFAVTQGYEVHGLSRSEKGDAKYRALGATPVRGDLGSFEVLTQESAEADVVLHLADALADDFSRDYEEVLRIDAAAIDAIGKGLQGAGKILITTSGTLVVRPDPNGGETTETSPLSENPLNGRIHSEKNALELSKKGVKVCAVRLAPFVYGRGGSGVRLFMTMSLPAGQTVYVDEGSAKTSTIHVDDAARLFLLVAQKGKSGEVYNATSATDITFRELSEAMATVLDIPSVSMPHDEAISKFGEFFTNFLSAENRASSDKAVKELGWKAEEIGILRDTTSGSYVTLAHELKTTSAS